MGCCPELSDRTPTSGGGVGMIGCCIRGVGEPPGLFGCGGIGVVSRGACGGGVAESSILLYHSTI